MTTRRQALLTGVCLLASPAALGQRSAKIGILGPVQLERSIWGGPLVRALGEAGYRSGIEYRSADGSEANYERQARELVDIKCDVIFPLGPESPVRALLKTGTSTPVVFIAVDFDPIQTRIVSDLARPQGNVTGIYVPQGALVAKRIELLRELMPKAQRLLIFSDSFSKDQLPPARAAAERAGIKLTVVEFNRWPYDTAAAFDAGKRAGAQGFVGLASPNLSASRTKIASHLSQLRLPAVGSTVSQASAGYLMSLGPDIPKTTQRAAAIGARILKGTRPTEIPVEQADQFELAVNSTTAKALGVRIPESIMARATRIVE
jgi:putative ABC transport system substrate-binding protein